MPDKQNVLLIGAGGGREHALAWKLAQSPQLGRLYVTPGNGGLSQLATVADVKPLNKPGLIAFARTHDIGLTVVVADDPLAAGVVDAFVEAGLRVFGPTRAAARIESSKAFAKDLMAQTGVPTARYRVFTEIGAARSYILRQQFPLVIKASGLALGKGVYICQALDDAFQALHEIMEDHIFGESGSQVVIEEFLSGQEVSIQVLTDGHTHVILPTSQDHKPVGTNDLGPNTGGMGAYAPVPWVTPALLERIRIEVVEPILAGLAAAGSPFRGLLYPGLMIADGRISVLEFNARFGDPEPQSYLRLLQTDLLAMLNATVDGTLSGLPIEWSDESAVCVVLASGGYPGKYQKGLPIQGIAEAEAQPGVVVFHAGTKWSGGRLVTNGGRVLGVSAAGRTLREARIRAYSAAAHIHFPGMQYRTDIGAKVL
jgi:phosphoribosylamine---glycine ligase